MNEPNPVATANETLTKLRSAYVSARVDAEIERGVRVIGANVSYFEKRAREQYPDPYEPTTITGENGWQYRYSPDGVFQVRTALTVDWCECFQCDLPRRITPAFAMGLGEIAQEYVASRSLSATAQGRHGE